MGKQWRNQILTESTGPLTSPGLFPPWTKGVCDPFRTHNRALTNSGLSFSRCLPGLGFWTGSHAHALLVPLRGRSRPGSPPRPLREGLSHVTRTLPPQPEGPGCGDFAPGRCLATVSCLALPLPTKTWLRPLDRKPTRQVRSCDLDLPFSNNSRPRVAVKTSF